MIQIRNALCLPSADIEALIQGKMIVAMPRLFVKPKRKFALYPMDTSSNPVIKAWAKCELCEIVEDKAVLDKIAPLTIWRTETLEQILRENDCIFLAYLRVYRLFNPFLVPGNRGAEEKLGKFIGLPQPLNINYSPPVLSDLR